jgi:hypothetical protein
MRNQLLLSVAAAALIAGAGLASAQAPSQGRDAPSAAPAVQQGAPAEKKAQQGAPAERAAPMNAPKGGAEIKAPDADTKARQADEKARKDGQAQRAQDNTGKPEMKADGKASPDGKTKADVKADPKAVSPAPTAAPSAAKPGDAKPSTTGQAAAGAPANLSTEQRTTIRTAIKQQNVQPATNVTFAISIGTAVPRTVRFYPVPVELVQIYPSWRGYDFFLVGNQIIVVNPRTLEIVAVLDA